MFFVDALFFFFFVLKKKNTLASNLFTVITEKDEGKNKEEAFLTCSFHVPTKTKHKMQLK
jgi:hypothetical protein